MGAPAGGKPRSTSQLRLRGRRQHRSFGVAPVRNSRATAAEASTSFPHSAGREPATTVSTVHPWSAGCYLPFTFGFPFPLGGSGTFVPPRPHFWAAHHFHC